MKAQFVNENIRFERGQDPKHSMGIGMRDEIVSKFEEEMMEKWPDLDEEEIMKIHPSYIEFDMFPLSTHGMNSLDRTIKKVLRQKEYRPFLKYVNDDNYEELEMEDVYDEETIYVKIL